MPHPLCTCTLRVMYTCGREFVPSVYFLPITWNGIPPYNNVNMVRSYSACVDMRKQFEGDHYYSRY